MKQQPIDSFSDISLEIIFLLTCNTLQAAPHHVEMIPSFLGGTLTALKPQFAVTSPVTQLNRLS